MRYYGSLSELRALVSLPSDLQFIEDWPAAQRGGNSSSKSFASLSLAQADYVPVNSLNHFPETIPGLWIVHAGECVGILAGLGAGANLATARGMRVALRFRKSI